MLPYELPTLPSQAENGSDEFHPREPIHMLSENAPVNLRRRRVKSFLPIPHGMPIPHVSVEDGTGQAFGVLQS